MSKAYFKSTAAALSIPDVKCYILKAGKFCSNRQAEAKVRFFVAGFILAVKRIKNKRFFFIADSRPEVCHADRSPGLGAACAQDDFPASLSP